MTDIRTALQNHEGLEDVDWDNSDEVSDIVASDGQGGEGVEYLQGEIEGYISYTETWGAWVLAEGYTKGEPHPTRRYTETWYYTYTVYPTGAAAKAGYIAAIEAKQVEGVTWTPDYCPIWDQLASAWK